MAGLTTSTYGTGGNTDMTTPGSTPGSTPAARADVTAASGEFSRLASAFDDHLSAVKQMVAKIDLSGLDGLAAEIRAAVDRHDAAVAAMNAPAAPDSTAASTGKTAASTAKTP